MATVYAMPNAHLDPIAGGLHSNLILQFLHSFVDDGIMYRPPPGFGALVLGCLGLSVASVAVDSLQSAQALLIAVLFPADRAAVGFGGGPPAKPVVKWLG